MVKVTFDYSLLRGKIFTKYKNLSEFANAIETPVTAISAKLLNGTSFYTDTVLRWAKALDLKDEEVFSVFFTVKVADMQLNEGDK